MHIRTDATSLLMENDRRRSACLGHETRLRPHARVAPPVSGSRADCGLPATGRLLALMSLYRASFTEETVIICWQTSGQFFRNSILYWIMMLHTIARQADFLDIQSK